MRRIRQVKEIRFQSESPEFVVSNLRVFANGEIPAIQPGPANVAESGITECIRGRGRKAGRIEPFRNVLRHHDAAARDVCRIAAAIVIQQVVGYGNH